MKSRWRDLIVAGVMIATAAALAFLTPEHIRQDLAMRILGVQMGLFVVVYANEAPKSFRQKLAGRCDPTTAQDLRRFTAWCLVFGGLGYSIAWLMAPYEVAPVLAMGLLGAALLLVVARVTWVRSRGSRT